MLRIVLGMIIGAAIGSGITYRLLSDDPAFKSRSYRPDPTLSAGARNGTLLPPALDAGTVPIDGSGIEPVLGARRDESPDGRAFDPGLDASVDTALARVESQVNERERYGALQAVGAHWAARDPRAALAAVNRLNTPADRSAYFSALARTLARLEPELLAAEFDGIRTLEDQGILMSALVDGASTSDSPQRFLELADQLPQNVAESLRQSVLQRWAGDDPMGALAYAQTMPLGQPREMALNVAAMSYAMQDPRGALVWLQSQTQVSPSLEMGIFSGIAQGEPAAAIDVLLSDDALLRSGSARAQMFRPMLMAYGQNGGGNRSAVADRLSTLGGIASEQLLPSFLQGWSMAEPREALSWVAAQGSSLDASAYAQVGAVLASRDVALAADFTSRVPADARAAWITSVGQTYASRDPEAAMTWLGQYRSEPGYGDAVLAVAQATASYDPARAAELVSSVGSNGVQAARATGVIAMLWSQRDPTAARSWAVGLPSGGERDAALQMLVGNTANGALDDELLGLFSTEQARAQAAFNGILRVAAGDPVRARAMLEQYVPDPAARARYEQALENMPPGANFGFFAPTGMSFSATPGFAPGVAVGVLGPRFVVDEDASISTSR